MLPKSVRKKKTNKKENHTIKSVLDAGILQVVFFSKTDYFNEQSTNQFLLRPEEHRIHLFSYSCWKR